MQLIIVLCLIAKLALVSGDCDVGKTVNDFDYNKFTGTWYILYHLSNEHDDNLEAVVDSFCVPDGNVSILTSRAYDKREGREVNFTGQVDDWDNTGFHATCDTVCKYGLKCGKKALKHRVHNAKNVIWNGRLYIVAVDYDRYFVGKFCVEESDTVLIYVAFRCAHPDDATMKDVKNALSDNDIPFDQLQRWNADRS